MLSSCSKELILLGIASAVVLAGAYYKNFFSLPDHKRKMAVSFWQLVGAFAAFLSPWMLSGFLFKGTLYSGLIAFTLATAILVWCIKKFPPLTQRDILIPFNSNPRSYWLGALSWIVAFPISQFFAKLINCLLNLPERAEQSIAKQILALKAYPLLFSLTIIAVVFLIPIVEELLFRGFLYNFMKNRLPRLAASLVSAALFTIAHYGGAEGLSNVEILVPLFILSLFLNHVYEKGGNILAPIALHQTFNCISLLLLLAS